jgi:hypothetical protein
MSRVKVYIIQEPTKRDHATGATIPIMDFRKVVAYGDPVVCLPSGRVSLAPAPTVDALREKLRHFTDNDYIVSVGDPSAIFAAAMVASDVNNGRCKLLKWDKEAKQYISVQMDIHHRTRKSAAI